MTADWVDVHLAHLAVHARTREPLAMLADDEGRCLVVSVRNDQAQVMALGPQPAREDDNRITQDLVADVLAGLGRHVESAVIADLVESRFHAALVLDDGTRITARPSDALALAVRDARPIRVAGAVMDEAGQSLDELRPADSPPESYEQVQEMRRFLDQVDPADFGQPGSAQRPTDPDAEEPGTG